MVYNSHRSISMPKSVKTLKNTCADVKSNQSTSSVRHHTGVVGAPMQARGRSSEEEGTGIREWEVRERRSVPRPG